MSQEYCRWIYRPGTNDSHFAMALCDKSMKYLSRVPNCPPKIGVANYYNNIICPSCGKPVRMDYCVIDNN